MLVAHVVEEHVEAKNSEAKDAEKEKKGRVYVRTDARALALQVAVKKFLSARLPRYMVPSFVIVLSALPLTPNGKINTRALPPPPKEEKKAAKGVDPAEYDRELTSTETKVAGAWAEVLQVANPGLDVSFFDLGGHSLAATHLALRMREALNTPKIPTNYLFKYPTIEKISAEIDAMLSGGASTARGTLCFFSADFLK
jgi:hypothetical protein